MTTTKSTIPKSNPQSPDKVWYPESEILEEPVVDKQLNNPNQSCAETSIVIEDRKGNSFHLCTAVRKYTGATLTFVRIQSARVPVIKVDCHDLYDALGLLRSLQYDVHEYNSIKPTETNKTRIQYAAFRLQQQAAAMGVRLTPPGTQLITVPGLDSLIQYLETQFQDTITSARSAISSGMVDFDGLQELYKPGHYYVDNGVGTGLAGVPTLMQCRACYYQRRKSLFGIVSSFHVAMQVVVAAGMNHYLVLETSFCEHHFGGTKSVHRAMDILTLPTPALLETLARRGECYQSMASPTHTHTGTGVMVHYDAGTFVPISKGSLRQGGTSRLGSYSQASRSSGRAMIDPAAAWARGVHCAIHSGTAADVVVQSLKHYHQSIRLRQQQPTSDAPVMDAASSHTDLLVLTGPLPPQLLRMTWPVMEGFSLQARSWGVALVQGISPVQFQESAFEALVLPDSRKKLIQALVSSHDTQVNADVMAGKGEGSIFLLHGPPGVGKTLTAEAIAEMLHKPLYVVSMGELGTSPESLEERLQDVLDLCIPWKALVLIDEAEMLLERRTKHDIVRNAMVCVMLRLLEYYRGILFLTTNRVESLDPAFQSRVTCALRYDALQQDSRRQIWINLFEKLQVDLTELDVEELAKVNINGRQIKNTLQLAMALARHEQVPLAQKHLRETIQVTTSFLTDALSGSED